MSPVVVEVTAHPEMRRRETGRSVVERGWVWVVAERWIDLIVVAARWWERGWYEGVSR